MKKILTLLLIVFTLVVLSPSTQTSFADVMPTQIRVIQNQTRIYNTTDIADLTSEGLENATIGFASLHQVFDVDAESQNFYQITFNSQTGHILKLAVIDNSVTSPTRFLQTNASLKTQSNAFQLADKTYNQVEGVLIEKDTRIKILSGYDQSKQYTLVSYIEGEQTLTYYVLTDNINPDGLDRNILLAITLIFIVFSAGTALYKIFNNKNKKGLI